MTEDGMVGWHNQFYGHEFEQAPGVGGGQGTTDWFQIGKGVRQGCILSPC